MQCQCKAHLRQLEFRHLGNLALFWHGIFCTSYRCCRPHPLWLAVVGWMCRQSPPETGAVSYNPVSEWDNSQYLTHLEVIRIGRNKTATGSRQQCQQANWEPLGVEGTGIAFGLVIYVTVCKANEGRLFSVCFCENHWGVWKLSTLNPWRFC